jgi:hypothetical protein
VPKLFSKSERRKAKKRRSQKMTKDERRISELVLKRRTTKDERRITKIGEKRRKSETKDEFFYKFFFIINIYDKTNNFSKGINKRLRV